jgi:hypothetical protein
MKKILLSFLFILFLTNCASHQKWVAENFTRDECSIPEKLAVTASVDKYVVVISIANTTRELWQFDVNSSAITLPATGWSSALIDNHVGNPNALRTVLPPGTSTYTVFPRSLMKDTDDELKDCYWRPWPIKEDQIIELVLVFIDQDGQNRICHLKADFNSPKKK